MLLGSGSSFLKFDYVEMDGTTSTVEMADFIDKVLTCFIQRIQDNILITLAPWMMNYNLTKADDCFFKNCLSMRKAIKGIVEDRKNGKKGGLAVGENKDIISMLLDDEVYENLEDIVDEVIVMFIAGTKTVQGTTTNFLGNYCNRSDFREKLHKELDPFVDNIKHDFLNAYTFEMTEDLEYLK